MRSRAFTLAVLMWLLAIAGSAVLVRADIEAPDSVAAHEPLIVKSTAEADMWQWRIPAPAKRVLLDNGRTAHIWAPPGVYQIELVEMTLLIDWEKQTKQVVWNEYVKTITVGTAPEPDPQPDPTPPPVPPGEKQIMLFYEADKLDNYPAAQRELLTSLKLRQELVQAGHVVLEMVEAAALAGTPPARYKAFFDAAKGQPLPILAMAPKAGGTVRAVPLPADKAGLMEVLK